MLLKSAFMAAAILLGAAAAPTEAATYNWSFACAGNAAGCSGSGTLETLDPTVPTYVTSISGTFGGSPISFLLPEDGYWANDNELVALTGQEFTGRGLSFQTETIWVNFYQGFDGDRFLLGIIDGGRTSSFDGGQGTFSVSAVSAVPLPAALPLLGAGLAGLGAIGWVRRRKNAAAS